MNAAETLGMGTTDMAKQMVRGVGKRGYGRLNNGIFTPLSISKNVMRGFIENARELGVRSPIFDSLGAIAQIRAQLFRIDLDDPGGFPLIENPLATPIIPDVVGDVTQAISNLNLGAQTVGANVTNNLNTGYGNLDQLQASGLTTNQEILLANQPLYQAMQKKQNLNKQNQTSNKNLGQT